MIDTAIVVGPAVSNWMETSTYLADGPVRGLWRSSLRQDRSLTLLIYKKEDIGTPAPSLWMIVEKLWVFINSQLCQVWGWTHCYRFCLLPGDMMDPTIYLQLRFISILSGPLLHLFPLLELLLQHSLFRIQFMSPVNNGNISLSLTVRPTPRLCFSFYRRI